MSLLCMAKNRSSGPCIWCVSADYLFFDLTIAPCKDDQCVLSGIDQQTSTFVSCRILYLHHFYNQTYSPSYDEHLLCGDDPPSMDQILANLMNQKWLSREKSVFDYLRPCL